jgi:5'-nucleotidase / UDP-sugar diphosphatase
MIRACKTQWFALAALLLCMPRTSSTQSLTILHVNDLHGQYLGRASGKSGRAGGMEALFETVRRERNDHSLLLDAGDFQTGTLISRLDDAGAAGGGMVKMMNLLGITASVPGNHEFDKGWENLLRMQTIAGFDLLAANLTKNGALFPGKSCITVKVNGLSVAVVGLVSGNLEKLVFEKYRDSIRIENPTLAARRLVRQLDPETDVIVLLTHQGFREDSLLAFSVPEADVIIGGHSHTALKRPMSVNGVLICQAGSGSEFLGRLDLEILNDRVASHSGRLVQVRSDLKPADPRMRDLAEGYRKRIEDAYGRVIGRLKVAWTPARDRESNVGNFFADVMRERAGTEIAAINSGGIRRGLDRGPVREMDVLEVFPFDNRLVRFLCTGKQLLLMVKTNSRVAFERSGGILQVSGLRYRAKWEGRGEVRILEATVNGEPILPDRTYSIATLDYLVPSNAKGYFGFEPEPVENLGVLVADAAIECIRRHPEIKTKVEGRMRHER